MSTWVRRRPGRIPVELQRESAQAGVAVAARPLDRGDDLDVPEARAQLLEQFDQLRVDPSLLPTAIEDIVRWTTP
jgi:hypothetical protein